MPCRTKTRTNNQPIYFLSYTGIPFYNRTTETKTFRQLKAAIGFAIDNSLYGYVIKQDANKNTFKKFINGFVPSATEQRTIEKLCENS